MSSTESVRIESLESRLFLHAGDIDVAFHGGSMLTTSFTAGGSHINDVAVLPDGSIVAGGSLDIEKKGVQTGTDMLLIKYNFDGTLDTSFGDGGEIAATPRGVTSADQITVGTDGNIYVRGDENGAAAMIKFDGTGKLDTAFGKNGSLLFTDLANNIANFTLDPSNRVIITGSQSTLASSSVHDDGVVRRFTSEGKIDSTFHGGTDFLLAPIGTTDTMGQFRTMQISRAVVDANGNILFTAADSLYPSSGINADVVNNYLYRITASGKIDRTFGSSGSVKLSDGIEQQVIGVLASGQILVDVTSSGVLHLSRYDSDGTLDLGYGTNGISPVAFGAVGNVAVGPDGSVAHGTGVNDTDSTSDFAVERILPDGQTDSNFGTAGILTLTSDNGDNFVSSVTLAPDGTLVIGGQTGALSPSGKVDTRAATLARVYSGAGPAVQLIPRTLKTKSRYLSMTVLIRDDDGVDTSKLDNNDLKLFDADGNTRKIRLLNSEEVNGSATYIQATYRIVAPNNQSTWLASDNGTYEVRLQKQQIFDTNSNAAAAQVLGTLIVKIT